MPKTSFGGNTMKRQKRDRSLRIRQSRPTKHHFGDRRQVRSLRNMQPNSTGERTSEWLAGVAASAAHQQATAVPSGVPGAGGHSQKGQRVITAAEVRVYCPISEVRPLHV